MKNYNLLQETYDNLSPREPSREELDEEKRTEQRYLENLEAISNDEDRVFFAFCDWLQYTTMNDPDNATLNQLSTVINVAFCQSRNNMLNNVVFEAVEWSARKL
jgi:hypothetical protein